MELFLNVVWVLLAFPAYWLWRRKAGWRGQGIASLQCFLALGCALFLLFPVISATDDVHVMRAEIEDSVVSKRAVRQAASDKGSAWINRLQSPPATAASADRMSVPEVGRLEVFVVSLSTLAGPSVSPSGRAPPLHLHLLG